MRWIPTYAASPCLLHTCCFWTKSTCVVALDTDKQSNLKTFIIIMKMLNSAAALISLWWLLLYCNDLYHFSGFDLLFLGWTEKIFQGWKEMHEWLICLIPLKIIRGCFAFKGLMNAKTRRVKTALEWGSVWMQNR